MATRRISPACRRGWVCENHPDKPWRSGPGGCECGAGAPCLACNSSDGPGDPPGMAGVFTSVTHVRGKTVN